MLHRTQPRCHKRPTSRHSMNRPRPTSTRPKPQRPGAPPPAEVDRTSDSSSGDAPLFEFPVASGPAAAAPESDTPAPWQTDTVASPGAAAPESDVAYGPNMAAGGAAPDLPGAPAPDEPTEVFSAPGNGGVGEGDAIEEPASGNPDSIGLSGIGEGGGGMAKASASATSAPLAAAVPAINPASAASAI